jgi:hypothetical protein
MDLAHYDVEMVKALRGNFGVAGEKWVRFLVRNRDLCEQVVKDTYKALYEDFAATNDERFWISGCASLVAAGVLAGSQYADIMDYPMKAIVGVLRSMVHDARRMVKDAQRTAEDVLNSFVRQFYGKLVVVRKVEGTTLARLGGASEIDETITRTDVMGRVEHLQDGFIELFIDEQIIRSFCASMSFGYADFKKQLAKNCGVKFVTKNMLAFTKGPPLVCKAMQITRKGEDVV